MWLPHVYNCVSYKATILNWWKLNPDTIISPTVHLLRPLYRRPCRATDTLGYERKNPSSLSRQRIQLPPIPSPPQKRNSKEEKPNPNHTEIPLQISPLVIRSVVPISSMSSVYFFGTVCHGFLCFVARFLPAQGF